MCFILAANENYCPLNINNGVFGRPSVVRCNWMAILCLECSLMMMMMITLFNLGWK